MSGTTRDPYRDPELAKQHRIGKEKQIESEHGGEAEAKRLDAPAMLRWNTAQELLDKHQAGDRKAEPDAERGPAFHGDQLHEQPSLRHHHAPNQSGHCAGNEPA